ncbi:fimbrial protein [Parabacteroides faecis]|uniref:Major fimbrial subunit protein N-terminal domain-containing protein n=1 Tax=Parabacteroides faecis TaxID=1217282 RepID=A0ABR6KGL5_9BACT|nr:fimbrial protein [Parabacteroides faecis]MBB4620453.1 hypothetical protein [Parabacteroides faecis]GGK04962.1 DUF4906 domain-containing protein [Parabacteroides faecis]
MKKYSIYLVYMLFGLFLFGSCSDESIVNKKDVVEGVPVSLKIPYTAPEMDIIMTRAGKSDVKLLSDLYVFTFDSYSGEFVSGENVLIEGSNSSTGSISINTTSGYRNIYAVANTLSGMYPSIQSKLNEVIANELKESEFLKIAAELSSDNVENNDDIMLMSGQWSNGSETKCLVPAGNGTLSGTIKIKRVAAKVTFNIKTGPIETAKGTFTAKEYQVLRVPYGAKLFENGTASISNYFDVKDFMPIKEGGSFTFYMSENLKQPLKECSDHNDRELYRETENEDKLSRTFINADPNATYVIIKGSFVGKADDPTDGKSGSVVAPRVLYIIHLGKGAGTVANESYDANDFDTYRNTDYIYNLTVNGVDNIVVEVLTNDPDKDNKPREEGDVIFGGDNDVILRCDAHFEQRLLHFTKDKLKDYSFAVKTPYTDKVYDINSDGIYPIMEGDDLYWVTFYKNPNNESYCYSYTSAKQSSDANLWTVEKLVKELKKWKEGTDHEEWGEEVNFTCFVNEFYYNDKPKEWYKYVNTGEDRTLQILCETSSQQAGLGSSSVTKNAQYVITQRPIETIYKKAQSVAGSIVAWGIETVNETGRLISGGGGSNADHGRKNMAFNGDWDDFLNFNKRPNDDGTVNYMKQNYEKAYYACLQRNRDENGNGQIDPDEIKWYLPSSKQYISLWIGNEAISSEANIYGAEGGDGKISPDRHFYTSTNGALVYWAEEGYSLGGVGGDNKYVLNNDGGRRQYRCVRDLGITKEQLEASNYTLSPIYKKSGNSITLDNLSSVSLRTQKAVGELKVHHEREDINKPYSGGLTVASEVCKEYRWGWVDVSEDWNEVTKNANNNPTNSYCVNSKDLGSGWRLPNQRELGVMYVAGTGGSGLCRTYYSGVPWDWKDGNSGRWYKKGESHTFQISSGVTLKAKNTKTTFRCVKDN